MSKIRFYYTNNKIPLYILMMGGYKKKIRNKFKGNSLEFILSSTISKHILKHFKNTRYIVDQNKRLKNIKTLKMLRLVSFSTSINVFKYMKGIMYISIDKMNRETLYAKRFNLTDENYYMIKERLLKNLQSIVFNEMTSMKDIKNVYDISKIKTIEKIIFYRNFNKDLTHDMFPFNVKKVMFSYSFNMSVDILPPSLTHLKLGDSFNKNVDNLPASLTHLKMGWKFNQPIDRLPPSLTHLNLLQRFDQPIDNLPSTLTHLSINSCFNRNVDNLPASLLHLHLKYWFNQPVDRLPPSLKSLTLDGRFNLTIDKLPKSLLYLRVGTTFNQRVDNLPSSLKYMYFGGDFNQSIDTLPDTITHLSIGINFNKQVMKYPKFLIFLHFGSVYYHPMNNLPVSLKQLILRFKIISPLNMLPKSLDRLTLGNVDTSLDLSNLSINKLTIGCGFENIKYIPPSLTMLKIIGYNKTNISNVFESIKILKIRETYITFSKKCVNTLKQNNTRVVYID